MAGIRSRTAIRAAAWTGAAVIAGATLYGVASAAMVPPTPSGATVATQNVATEPSGVPDVNSGAGHRRWGRAGHPGLRRFLAGRVLHGEFVVAANDGGTKTVLVQKGEVTAVGKDTVTVRSRDGFMLTWRLNEDTKIRTAGRRDGRKKLSDLAPGDRIAAIGQKTSGGVTARAVIVRAAKDDDRNHRNNGNGPREEPSAGGSAAVLEQAALTI